MINWWLIGFLVFLGSGWVITLLNSTKKGKFDVVSTLVALTLLSGLMYMSGIFTELWDVYK